MQTGWERQRGEVTHYASIGPEGVLIGSHRGSGHTDSAGMCTLDEFLAGRFHDVARQGLGPKALAEMIAAAEGLVLG